MISHFSPSNISTNFYLKRPLYVYSTTQIEKRITLFAFKWQKFLPFADGKKVAISNGKHFSCDRKNIFRLIKLQKIFKHILERETFKSL